MMSTVSGVSGSRFTSTRLAARNASNPSAPLKVRTPSMAVLRERLQPLTGNSNCASAPATRCPSTPSPITPTGRPPKLAHLPPQAPVIEPHHQRCGRQAQPQQRIHARAQVEQGSEPRLLVDELLRRPPDHGLGGLRGTGLPQADVSLWQCGGQPLQPRPGLGVGTAKGDFHLVDEPGPGTDSTVRAAWFPT